MRQRLALPLAALLTALLTASGIFSAPQGAAAEAGTSVSAHAKAGKARQCLPKQAGQSLVVRGKVTCKEVKRFLPSARELAAHTQDLGYERFTIRGFMCELRPDYRRFACHDINGKPKRSFVWADHSA
jgi:hypothetical protein